MELGSITIEKLKFYGIGRRNLTDELFVNEKPPPRLGVYEFDDENLCHEIIKSSCNIPGCTFTTESLLDFENHYNASHRYSCAECKKVLPSPHLLDLHIQESHDSFFAVMSERKPSYCCYIEECKDKFKNANDRLEHCVKEHKLPKDFRFEQKVKTKNKKEKAKNQDKCPMELDGDTVETKRKIVLNNNKQKTFTKYTGKVFTKSHAAPTAEVNMDQIVTDLKESLPE